MTYDLADIAQRFHIHGAFREGVPYGSGHINDTFAVTFDQGGTAVRYILQRINHAIFKQPTVVMENIGRVTRFQREILERNGLGSEASRRALTLIPSRGGADCVVDNDGNTWRAYIFIEKARTYDQIETTDQAFQAARAFGEFMKQLRALPGAPLTETIPDFHNTRARYDALQRAVETDPHNRAAGVAEELAFARKREAMVDVLLDLQADGTLPTVTTHNDTKLNNVMLDDATGEGICVIDLDTVMPGLSLYDFGDMIRTSARPTPEDETDLGKVIARPDKVEAVTRGYLAAAGDVLNETERAHLMFAGRLITLEIGIRFLTDHIEGDGYFKIHRPGHNLDRCRCQFAMVASLESQRKALDRLVPGR